MSRVLSILLLAGLGGCVYNPHTDIGADFGESVHANIASQVVNPLPSRPSAAPGVNGVRMNAAFDRYQTNRVYRPVAAPSLQMPTGTVGSGSGGGGGSGGAGSSGGGSGGGGAGSQDGSTSPN